MDTEELYNALANLYEKAQVESYGVDIIEIGVLSLQEVSDIQQKIDKNLQDFKKIIRFSETRHIAKMHGKQHERVSGQIQIEVEHFIQIPELIKNYDTITFQPKNHKARKYKDSILFEKGSYSIVFDINFGSRELTLKTMWVKK